MRRLVLPGADVVVKMESANLHGGTKDRSAGWILDRAYARGELTARTTVVESSSGNFALALAMRCRALGIEFVPVVDPYLNHTTEQTLAAVCSRIEYVHTPDPSGAYLPARLARVGELVESLPHAYWPNQYANTDAADAHYHLTGAELVDELDELDLLFVGVGTGATITGVAHRVLERFPLARVVAVDAAGSRIFGDTPAPRHIPGLGSTIVPAILDMSVIDEVVHVPELEAVRACHELVREHGLFGGGSTGSVFAAIRRYLARNPTGRRPTIACISPDGGQAYLDSVYDPQWVHRTLIEGAES
ncbi:2,3-diaminopropionate biosynthesis protein SbnA [Jatrophihabitans endophyticus]|uniref:2,3-diaminopropionate biosynthesis protein SbnA n=1 Tax=Jatrophihabitans endophyticus TaxID=1206085 RepID=UPI00190E9151|nr:2,3-diaminopropionate biosynthesis protein SbnA [Jatrophihabitans endophyticus]